METENRIIVIYIGVAGIRSEDIEDFVRRITQRISPETINGEIITVPVNSYETRIECINPKYITEEDLIKKHTELMKELQVELEHQINLLKKENEKN